MFTPGPVSLIDGTSTTATVIIYDQYGAAIPLPQGSTVTYSGDNLSVATSTPNTDGVTDAIAGVGIGIEKLTVSVTIPGVAAPLTDSEVITVTAAPSVPTSAKLAFGS